MTSLTELFSKTTAALSAPIGCSPAVSAETWYHVVNRGDRGTLLIPNPDDAASFVTALGVIVERLPVEVHAYCAMGSRYQLLARAREEDLLRAIDRLEKAVYGIAERPALRKMAFGRHLLGITRHIHRNPVEAGLVKCPSEWRWSSYRGYLDQHAAPGWLRSDVVLAWFGQVEGRERYRQYVEGERC